MDNLFCSKGPAYRTQSRVSKGEALQQVRLYLQVTYELQLDIITF